MANPGDFIFGDDDGLQVIPKDYVDEVLLCAEGIIDSEVKERQEIREGMSLDDLYKKYGEL